MSCDDWPRVPQPLTDLVAAWRAGGKAAQPGIEWPRQRWIDAFPEHAERLMVLPDRLDREAVRRACSDASASPMDAVGAFIVVMAWGYGNVGYGPYRTRRILEGTPDAAERLLQIARRAGGDPVDAYRALASASESRLRGLGPAFGTKYLYFTQAPSAQRVALIFDAYVANWLHREAGVKFDHVPWSESVYRRYLELMHCWAASLAIRPDELEYVMFQAEASGRGSQWGTAPPSGVTHAQGDRDGWPLGQRFEAALIYAAHVHGGQRRKSTQIPYLAHLLSVASLVLEDGGDEDEAIAGLLHDAAEDQGGQDRLDDIAARFGERVARIVQGCSDTLATPKPPWRPRKEAYIERLGGEPADTLRVSLADKLHNARAIVRDVESEGAAAWERFNAGSSEQAWYYAALAEAFGRLLPGPMATQFRQVVERLCEQAEGA